MDEHQAMLSCRCIDEDRLLCICLNCGKAHLPDPSWAVVAIGFALLAFNAWSWWAM